MTTWIELGGSSAGAWLPLLLDVTLKGAVALLAAMAVSQGLRHASAAVRHQVWTVAFAAVLALPLLALALPSWRVTVPAWMESPVATDAAPAATTGAADTHPPAATATRDGGVAMDRVPLAGGYTAEESPAKAASGSAAAEGGGRAMLNIDWRLALLVWIAGAVLLLARLSIGVLSAWRMTRLAVPLDDRAWRDTVAALKARLGIAAEIRVLTSARVGSPMTFGVLRPALLLPENASSWSADRRRAVVLHELGHVKRRDCLVHVLAEATRALHWMNPLAWVGARRIRAERERACDDMVLEAGTASAAYAALLLDVARHRGDRRLEWAAVAMARPSELEGRVLAILDPGRARGGPSRTRSRLAYLFAGGLVLPLAAFQAAPTAGGTATPTPTQARAWVPPSSSAPAPPPAPSSDPVPSAVPSAELTPRADLVATAAPDVEAQEAPSDTTQARYVAIMAQALQSDRESMRAQAAQTLGTMESTLAVAPLSDAIADESAEVRRRVAWALGMIESAGGIPALVIALGDEDVGVRKQAAWALGMIEDSSGVDPLLPALLDESEEVREQAAWALGMIEDQAAVEGLIQALRGDASEDVREQAAWALGMIEAEEAAEALADALEDESEAVAMQAMWALGMVLR